MLYFTLQLGIKMSISHEKEPLGTGVWSVRSVVTVVNEIRVGRCGT